VLPERSQVSDPIELDWQSTPALWMATRAGLCWCYECAGKHPKGFGKTREAATAALIEQEDSRDD
jgi:hypothetical protein